MADERKALMKAGIAAVRKKMRESDLDTANKALEYSSVFAGTGALSLDRLFSGRNPGGIPMGPRFGRTIHIAGEWSTAKSLILDHLFKSTIKDLSGLSVCTETEGTRDPHFANAIGLPLDLLLIQRPKSFEEGFDMFEEWHTAVRKEDETIPILWGWDSLDSTEAEKSASQGFSEGGGWHYGGGRAEMLGAGLRRFAGISSKYPTTLVMLNQTRDNVGVMFGEKKRTPGGNPPHFYSTLEIMLKGSPRPDKGFVRDPVKEWNLTKEAEKRLGLAYIKDAGRVRGRYIQAKVTKTKMALTFDTTADFYVDFQKGVHPWEGLAERLMFEGMLSTGSDGLTDFEMCGQKFPTKRDWLTWLSDKLNKGEYEAVGLGAREEENADAPVLEA
jgi:recombination protein RecA